jgi:hypothetical protein
MTLSHDADPVSEVLRAMTTSYAPTSSRGLTPGAQEGAVRSRVVLVPLFDMTAGAVARATDTLARRIVVEPDLTPVIFTSLDVFATARRHGWVVEHVLAEESWQRTVGAEGWMSHVLSRFDFVLATYVPTSVVIPDLDGRFSRSRDMEPFDHLGRGDHTEEGADVGSWRAWGSLAREGETSTLTLDVPGAASLTVSTSRASLPMTFVEYVDPANRGPRDWARQARARGWSTVSIEARSLTGAIGPSPWGPIRRAVPSVMTLVSHPADLTVPPGYDFALGRGKDLVLSSAFGDAILDPARFPGLLRRLEDLAAS